MHSPIAQGLLSMAGMLVAAIGLWAQQPARVKPIRAERAMVPWQDVQQPVEQRSLRVHNVRLEAAPAIEMAPSPI